MIDPAFRDALIRAQRTSPPLLDAHRLQRDALVERPLSPVERRFGPAAIVVVALAAGFCAWAAIAPPRPLPGPLRGVAAVSGCGLLLIAAFAVAIRRRGSYSRATHAPALGAIGSAMGLLLGGALIALADANPELALPLVSIGTALALGATLAGVLAWLEHQFLGLHLRLLEIEWRLAGTTTSAEPASSP